MSGLCLNSMTHYIIQMGNFFGSFFCLFILIFLSHLVMDLDTTTLRCWEGIFSAPATVFDFLNAFNCALIGLFISAAQLTGLSDNSQNLFSFLHLSWKIHRSQDNFFFLPKKYMSTSPFPVFSPFLSRLLFLDCLTICCSECL